MQARFLQRIDELPAAAWNALAGDYPFIRHEFLAALERSGCVSAASGWIPHHLVLEDAHGLCAVAPVYEKAHSWGEFVFDFSWARAWEGRGLHYYPKLLLAIPFTPATGPRWLVRAGLDAGAVAAQLLDTLQRHAGARGLSSVHALFVDEPARLALAAAGWLARRDCHFQWRNAGYANFEDFLATFSAEKRKKARRERRRVAEQGIVFRTLSADALDEAALRAIYALHASTFVRYGHEPYLNLAFFREIRRHFGQSLIIKLALLGTEPVAAALFFRSQDTLYGRYWGASADYHSLHFEACYYQGIEYCIEHGLARFEPGTQGEHKLSRGFEPTYTWSGHWLADPTLRRAVAAFLQREHAAIEAYAASASEHLPFRQGDLPLDLKGGPVRC